MLSCGPNSLHLAALHHEGALAGRSGDRAGRAMGGDVLEPLALLVGDLARRPVGCDAQQPAIVAAAHEAVARRIADQRQHRAAMQRLGRRRLGGVDVGGQQAHAAVAQGEGHDRCRRLLKAQAAAGASAATARPGGRVCRQAGFERSSFTCLLQAVVEAALEVLAVEIAADEDELARRASRRPSRACPSRNPSSCARPGRRSVAARRRWPGCPCCGRCRGRAAAAARPSTSGTCRDRPAGRR